MEVFYRLYPGNEKGNAERPFFPDDKLALAYVCLMSFVQSCASTMESPRLTFLLDGCPEPWQDMVRHLSSLWDFEDVRVLTLDAIGNAPSFRFQLDLALESQEDVIYFAEDDYLYRREAIREMYRFARQSDQFWTPYDHPDRYTRDDDRNGRATQIGVVGEWKKLADGTWQHKGWHWRRVESACMTFGGQKRLLEENEKLLRDLACMGRHLWYPLLDRGYELWSPIPALATHVRNAYLSMCADWREMVQDVLGRGFGYSPAVRIPYRELADGLLIRLEEWR